LLELRVVLLVGGVQEAMVMKNKLIEELEECVRRVVGKLIQYEEVREELPCHLALAYIWYCPKRVLHTNPNTSGEEVDVMWEYVRVKADEMLRRCRA
jgi:hypothetical protein